MDQNIHCDAQHSSRYQKSPKQFINMIRIICVTQWMRRAASLSFVSHRDIMESIEHSNSPSSYFLHLHIKLQRNISIIKLVLKILNFSVMLLNNTTKISIFVHHKNWNYNISHYCHFYRSIKNVPNFFSLSERRERNESFRYDSRPLSRINKHHAWRLGGL